MFGFLHPSVNVCAFFLSAPCRLCRAPPSCCFLASWLAWAALSTQETPMCAACGRGEACLTVTNKCHCGCIQLNIFSHTVSSLYLLLKVDVVVLNRINKYQGNHSSHKWQHKHKKTSSPLYICFLFTFIQNSAAMFSASSWKAVHRIKNWWFVTCLSGNTYICTNTHLLLNCWLAKRSNLQMSNCDEVFFFLQF